MTKENLRLTLYDFDDTIYKGDSSIKFWWFVLRKRPLFLFLSPYFLVIIFIHSLGIMSRDKFKQAIYILIHKVPQTQIKAWVSEYWNKEKKNINSWFEQRLNQEKKQGLIPVCISASPRFLIENIIQKLNIPYLICTEMITKDGFQTNKMNGPNCRGQEKVRRLNKWAQDQAKTYVIEKFTSDSKADLPLYNLAHKKFFVKNGVIKTGIPE